MRARPLTWILLALVALTAWQVIVHRPRSPDTDTILRSRPTAAEAVRMFGGGPTTDPERDAALRRQVLGRGGRSDSDLVYLEFAADGGLRGADINSDPEAVARGEEKFSVVEYVGRWEINNGWLRLHKPQHIIAIQLRFTDDDRLQLYDMIERIDQAWVYHRLVTPP